MVSRFTIKGEMMNAAQLRAGYERSGSWSGSRSGSWSWSGSRSGSWSGSRSGS